MNEVDFLSAASTFREKHVRSHAASWDSKPTERLETLRLAAKTGLMKLDTPHAHGGFGLPFSTKLRFCEEMARGDWAFTFSLINTQNVAAKLAYFGDRFSDQIEEIVEGHRFGGTALTEPSMGSDLLALQTKARKVKDGWRLDGEKAWIANADIGDYFVVYAQTKELGDRSGIKGFLVKADVPGFERTTPHAIIGGCAIGVGGFKLKNVYVPDSDALFRSRGGANSTGSGGFKFAMAGVNSARVYVAAMCVGSVADSLQQSISYGRSRRAFGKPLIEHQGLRWKLSDVSTELAAMRSLTYNAGRAVEEQSDAILLAAQAKKFATERSVALIEKCMQALGAQGLSRDNSIGRHLIAAKISGYTDGTIEMMNERIGASFFNAS